MPAYYHFPTQTSPTHYNLARYLREEGWRPGRFRWRASFGADQLLFHEQAAQCLEYKHQLANLVATHCPNIMPFTLGINDQNWPQVLGKLAALPASTWILKPSTLNNGQHIKLFQHLNSLEAHFSSPRRMGGEQVVQQYLQPQLLRDDRKYSIRMFMAMTHHAGAFLYPKGYFNVAMHSFAADNYQDLRSHLTNEHLQGDAPNVIQIPSERFEFFSPVYQDIKQILQHLVAALRSQYPEAFSPHQPNALALFGVDFMVDHQGRVWLLECNHGPCFPVSDDHVLQSHLYRDFWRTLIREIVSPMSGKTPPPIETVFDKL